MEDIHVGELIKKRAKDLRIGPTELGLKINTSKQNVYGIYKRQSIDTDLLKKISVALEHDFFLYYVKSLRPLHKEELIFEPEAVHQSKLALSQLEKSDKELEELKKENRHLQRINQLLEEKMNMRESARS